VDEKLALSEGASFSNFELGVSSNTYCTGSKMG